MKTLLSTYLLFLTTLLGAGIPDGPAYDLYLYHGKAQLDYEGSGSKNHGRTLPYAFVGSVTSWAMRNGATVTFRGNDARIVKRNTSDPCESWDTNDTETENGESGSTGEESGASSSEEPRWLYSRAGTTDIGIAFPNQYDPTPSKRWPVNCRQKIDASSSYGDDTHAAAGIIAIRRDVPSYNPETFQQQMTAEQLRIGASTLAMQWMIRELAVQTAENLFPGEVASGRIIVTPVVWNRFPLMETIPAENLRDGENAFLDGQQANSWDPVPVHGQNLTLEVTVPLNKHVAPGAVPGAWYEPVGAVYVGEECLNARLYMGQNAYIRVFAEEMGEGFSLAEALHITERDTVMVVEEAGKTYVYNGPFKFLTSQQGASNQLAEIEMEGETIAIKLYNAVAPYDPEKENELKYLLEAPPVNGQTPAPPQPFARLFFTKVGQSVLLVYFSSETNGIALYEAVEGGWEITHGMPGGYDRTVRTLTQESGTEVLVTRQLVSPSGAVLETSRVVYQNFKRPEGFTYSIPGSWNGATPTPVSYDYESVDDWRVRKVLEGEGSEERITEFQYFSSGVTLGKLNKTIGPDGEWSEYEYDASGRLKNEYHILAGMGSASKTNHRHTQYVFTDASTIPSQVVLRLGGSEVGKTTIAVPDGQIQVNVSQEASSTGQAAFNLPSVSRYQYALLHNTQSASGLVSTRETTFNMNVLEIITESGAPAAGSSGFDLTVDKGFRNENTYNRSSQTPLSSKLGWLENGNEMGVYFRRVDEGNFALDGRRRLVSATSTAGVSGTDSVSYGLHGLVSHTDRFGRTTAHQYTPSGQLVSTQMESFLVNHVLAPAGARVYSYPAAMPDGADPLITSAGILKQRTDPVGRVTQLNRSGSDGNVTLSATLPGGSDALQTYYGDGLPHTLGGTALPAMTYEYAWGQNTAAQVTQKYTGNPNEKTVREVDSLGRIVRELAPNPAGVGDVEVIYHYDPQTGHLRKITRSNAVATFYEYDELNRIKRVALNVNINDNNDSLDLDGSDRVSEWEYSIGESSDGVVLTTKEYLRRPELGTKLLIRERAESIDGLHSRVKELDLPTAVRSTSVNQGTFTTTWTHPDGTSTVTVESEGLLRSRVHKDANGNTIEGFTYNYSAKRLLESVTDAGRGTTEYEYYDDGSLAWSLSPSAGSGHPDVFLQYDYSGIGGLSYDNQGMVKKTTLSDGTSTITEVFTPRGELRSRSGALGYPVSYTYDHAGRVKTLATSTGGTNSVVAVTTWNYNDAGLPESKIFPGGSEITYTYHSNGVPHTETQPGGIVKTYGSTPLGQISSIAYAGATTPSVHYTYDVLGRPKTVTDASGTRTQNYDNNTLLPTTLTYSDGIFDEITIQTLYNMRRPWAVGISHSGTLLHGNVLTYDTASRIFSVFGNYTPHVYTYAPSRGSEIDTITSGTLVTDHDYDNLGRLTRIQHQQDGNVLSSHAYTYNDLSQLLPTALTSYAIPKMTLYKRGLFPRCGRSLFPQAS